LNTNEKQNNEFVDILKSNYKLRIEEIDKFSRDFSNISADFRSKYLIELIDLLQHNMDLQKKLAKNYPIWYDPDLLGRESMMITKSWINNIHLIGSFYTSLLDYGTKNMRIFNQGITHVLQMIEMYHDMFENMPPIQKNMLISLIKQVRECNDKFMQEQIPQKKSLSNKKAQKNQIVAKEIS
jgi:hypothetical protein